MWVDMEEVGFESSPEAWVGGVRKVEKYWAGLTIVGNYDYSSEHDWPGNQDST